MIRQMIQMILTIQTIPEMQMIPMTIRPMMRVTRTMIRMMIPTIRQMILTMRMIRMMMPMTTDLR